MAAVDLVVTDLDGTFWFDNEQTHPATVAAWRELERRGIPVLVATGRRLASTRDPLAQLGLSPPAVVLNGALAVDLATGDRFHTSPYDVNDAVAVLRAYRAAGLEPCVYVDHHEVDVFVSARPSTHPDHLAAFGTSAREADLEEIVHTVPVLMFGIMGHPIEPFRALSASLAEAAETHVNGLDQYGGHSCTATPAGLSKWVGVVEFCTRAGLDPARVLAIGDQVNDRELLAAAAIAVAPADGHPDIVRDAHHVVASPRAGGWAGILDLV
jgi:HAD superfamily hydrolase (TIGR01484 family)